MPISNRYYASFTGGSPYDLGTMEHQYGQEDEDEQLRRDMERAAQASRLRSYENSVKQMEQERALRLGYGTMQQKMADPYSDLYSSQPAPAGTSPVNIGMEDPNGGMTERLFRPLVRSVAPGAQEKISLFREATRSGSALSDEEYRNRVDAKTQGQIEAAKARDALMTNRQNQQAKQGMFRTSAQIQAGAPGADDLSIARDYETSATAAMEAPPEQAAPDTAGTEPAAPAPAAAPSAGRLLNVKIGGKVVQMTPEQVEEYKRQRRGMAR